MDTIAAVATGMGEAGIAIVRVSGPEALTVAGRVFTPHRRRSVAGLRSHTLTFGHVAGAGEAMLAVMRAPYSYTCEDVVEIHSHGGAATVQQVLKAVLAAGARPAEPGEFTRRAFLNGRIDLAQAEAVIDLIRAKTDRAVQAAAAQMAGSLSRAVHDVREQLLLAMAELEAGMDFPEEHLEVDSDSAVDARLADAALAVQDLLRNAASARLLRDGLRVAVVGPPNAGKSSLFNRLVGENRAIVTPVPGTTRDVIEAWVSLSGIPVALSDTAGLRESDDPVERIGVERTRAAMEHAALVLLVVDAATREAPPALARPHILVANKCDLPGARPPEGALAVSALTGAGIPALEEAILQRAAVGDLLDGEAVHVTSARHRQALEAAAAHLAAARAAWPLGASVVAGEVRAARERLGEVTGETVDDALLDRIFSQFCIGK